MMTELVTRLLSDTLRICLCIVFNIILYLQTPTDSTQHNPSWRLLFPPHHLLFSESSWSLAGAAFSTCFSSAKISFYFIEILYWSLTGFASHFLRYNFITNLHPRFRIKCISTSSFLINAGWRELQNLMIQFWATPITKTKTWTPSGRAPDPCEVGAIGFDSQGVRISARDR